jgi:hypothetical protein
LPFNVYIPVAASKRRDSFLFAAIRLPVARNWRSSALIPFELAGLLRNVFMRLNCHTPMPGASPHEEFQRVWLARAAGAG